MKGVILAGGRGTRLFPLTSYTSKQLLAVYDKPMIYYSITVLIAAGIKEIAIVTTFSEHHAYKTLLGTGKRWGVKFEFFIQDSPEGIPQALVITREFIAGDNVTLILGDNIFSGSNDITRAVTSFTEGAQIFAYRVADPRPFGVVEFYDDFTVKNIEEKPQTPRSNYAIPGIYIYDKNASGHAASLTKSDRGEYEINDLNKIYLARGELRMKIFSRGFTWIDAGTPSALLAASVYIENIERMQGIKIGCPEEAAYLKKFITQELFINLAGEMPNCDYKKYLLKVANET